MAVSTETNRTIWVFLSLAVHSFPHCSFISSTVVKCSTRKNNTAKNAKSPFVLSLSISNCGIFRCCLKHGTANARQYILPKILERLPASKRLPQMSSETEELRGRISHCKHGTQSLTENHSAEFQRQLVIKNWQLQHTVNDRCIMCKGASGAASSFQCIKNIRRLHIPSGAGNISATTKDSSE